MAREFRHAQGERKTYTYHQTYIHTYEPTYKAEMTMRERHERSIDKIIMDFRNGLYRQCLNESDVEFYEKRLVQLDRLRDRLEDLTPFDYSEINEINHKIRCIRQDFEMVPIYSARHNANSYLCEKID